LSGPNFCLLDREARIAAKLLVSLSTKMAEKHFRTQPIGQDRAMLLRIARLPALSSTPH
jgi:hypothetical protein